MKFFRRQEILAIGFVLTGASLMYVFMPISTKDGCWTHNILRNWEHFGLIRSGGKLVQNPGGINVLEQPETYGGHRPFFLYPSFYLGHIFGGAGRYGLLFYLVMTLAAAISIWAILGRTSFALMAASAVVLCPGFVRNAVVVDPIFVPVTLGLPAMLCVLQLLKAPKITLGVGLPLVAVGAMYTALNWTTAFPIAITVVYLSVSMPSQWKRWLLVFSIIGACAVGVTLTSISEKISSGDAVPLSSRLQTLYNAYLFGAGGYGGYPMNWPKATVRLISANVIGLLPLWAVYVWRIHESCRKGAALNWRAFLPLITAVLVIAGFRNAFAHHPWTAASILIYGAVFSMALLGGVNVPRDSAELPAGAIRGPLLRRLGFLTVCLMYACVVVWVLRVNSTDMDALVALIRQNTNRPDVIVVDRTLDPWLAQKAELGLSTMLDRRIAVTKERTAPIVQRGSAEKPRFLLTATNKEDNGTLVAHTIRPKSLAHRIVEGSLNWYRRAIARRDKRDRFETEAVYYLYKFP